MVEPEQAYPNENKLIELALAHVQGIFRGNGIKRENIRVLSQKIARHTMNAGTYLELKPVMTEKNAPGKTVTGQLVNSRDDAMRAVDMTMRQAANDSAAKAQMTQILLTRTDQGFGLNHLAVPLDFLKRDYTWHEACHTCHGTSKSPCVKCQGRKLETCFKCTGRGLMKCPMCRATGLLQGNKCPRCHAQRYVPCDGCRRSGMMPCRTCNATGVMKCVACGGQGWKSHVMTLQAQAMTYFEYDPKSIPKGAADAIEMNASRLAIEKRVEIKGRIADDKENVLGASYEVSFPYGEIVFGLGKREIKANLFGFKADLVEFPYILDKMIGPALDDLEDAAKNVGDVAEKIRKATRFRLIAQAFTFTHKVSVKKATAQLMKLYDIGLSLGTAEKIVTLAETTTKHITQKPRNYGLAAGLAIVAVLDAVYYLLPIRAKIGSYLPNPRFDFVLDILPLVLGGIITTLAIQILAAGAIKKALGHLTQKDQKSSLSIKTHASGWYGYAGTVFLTLLMIELASRQGASPYWYEMLRNLLTR